MGYLSMTLLSMEQCSSHAKYTTQWGMTKKTISSLSQHIEMEMFLFTPKYGGRDICLDLWKPRPYARLHVLIKQQSLLSVHAILLRNFLRLLFYRSFVRLCSFSFLADSSLYLPCIVSFKKSNSRLIPSFLNRCFLLPINTPESILFL